VKKESPARTEKFEDITEMPAGAIPEGRHVFSDTYSISFVRMPSKNSAK
jgi:hypothetical protein